MNDADAGHIAPTLEKAAWDRISQVRDEFERAWQAGTVPSIDDFLATWRLTFFLWLPGAVIYYLASRNQGFYVGATWITERYQIRDDNESRKILKIYELAKIEIRHATRVDATLRMVDHKKDELEAPLGLLEGNPSLWDYVYNGIVHSAANGAEIDTSTRELLHLPGPGGAEV